MVVLLRPWRRVRERKAMIVETGGVGVRLRGRLTRIPKAASVDDWDKQRIKVGFWGSWSSPVGLTEVERLVQGGTGAGRALSGVTAGASGGDGTGETKKFRRPYKSKGN